VITEFLEPGMFRLPPSGEGDSWESSEPEDSGSEPEEDDDPSPGWDSPITDREQDHFARIQLQRLDDSVYFKRHFG
jgi:hypothetical protein